MTEREVAQLLSIMENLYPSFKVDDPERMTRTWQMIFAEKDASQIFLALKTFVHTSGSAYAPTPSQLIALTKKAEDLNTELSIEAWQRVRKAIGNGIYHAEEEFEKLPDSVKKVVGSPQQLSNWAVLDTREIETVVQSNFLKAYDSVIKRDEQISLAPKEVMMQIQKLIGKEE